MFHFKNVIFLKLPTAIYIFHISVSISIICLYYIYIYFGGISFLGAEEQVIVLMFSSLLRDFCVCASVYSINVCMSESEERSEEGKGRYLHMFKCLCVHLSSFM